jgi:hypothetical protein
LDIAASFVKNTLYYSKFFPKEHRTFTFFPSFPGFPKKKPPEWEDNHNCRNFTKNNKFWDETIDAGAQVRYTGNEYPKYPAPSSVPKTGDIYDGN